MILGVKFVSVPAHDQDRALAFYTEKLGFRLITDQPFSPGQRWIELGIGNADTRFVIFTPPGQEKTVGDRFNGALACDDVEATWRQLTHAAWRSKRRPPSSPGANLPSCWIQKAIASSCLPERERPECVRGAIRELTRD